MSTHIRLLLLVLLFASVPTYSQGTASSAADDSGSELRDQDTDKAHGRPEDPGAHGRQNAAEKQSRGHGNGSKKVDAPEAGLPGESEDDDDAKSVKGQKSGKSAKGDNQKKKEQ